MPVKRNWIFSGYLFLFILLVLFLALTGLFLYLPVYLETRLIPKLAKDSGISGLKCNVRRIGLTGADFGPLIITADGRTALSVESIQIDYSPMGVYQKSLKKILLSGIEFHPEFRDGTFTLAGFDMKKTPAGTSSQKTSLPTDFSFSIPRIEIRHSVAVFKWENRVIRLPFELEITPRNGGRNRLQCSIGIYPCGQEITASVDLDLKKKKLLAEVDTRGLSLEKFTDFTKGVQGLTLSGALDLKADAVMDLENLEIVSASACLEFRNEESSFKNFILDNSPEDTSAFRLNINKIAGNKWKISGNSIAFSSPLPLQVLDMNVELITAQDAIGVSGNFRSKLQKLKESQAMPVNLMDPICFNWNLGFKLSKDGQWEFRLVTEPAPGRPMDDLNDTAVADSAPLQRGCGVSEGAKDTLVVIPEADENFKITAKIPRIDIFGNGKHLDGSVGCKINIPDVKTAVQSARLNIPVLTINGRADLGGFLREEKSFAAFDMNAPNADLSVNSIRMKIPHTSLSGKLGKNESSPLGLEAVGKITKAEVTDSRLKAKVTGISGEFPLRWPSDGSGSRGSVSINGISIRNQNIGSVQGTIRQTDFGFIFDAKHRNHLIPALTLNFSGESNILSPKDRLLEIHFELLHPQSAPDIDLGRFFPEAGKIMANGDLNINGAIIVDKKGMRSSVNSKLKNARISDETKRMAVEGVNLALTIPDLFDFRSKPRQQASFDSASYGDLKLNDGSVEFQIEPDGSIFIENSDFKWCNGKVYSQALRISPGVKDFNVILYCDRLNLAQVLEQFGLSNAEGQGTVNGRIPLRLNDGKLSFNDGFLFTTPGEGGTIKVTGTEILTSGIPPDTPQFTQIELAREALKDFQYQWAKMGILTEGEDLRMQLQFDGKPAHPLPFAYQKDLGGFVKIEAGSEGSIFQGIRLDVNFKFPLDKIMRHKGILHMIK
jgi:hypothetical protein